MFAFRLRILAFLVLLPGCLALNAQVGPATGSLEVSGRVKIGAKVEKIKRKRFYLFRGGLTANQKLIDKLKTLDMPSRDCFYCQVHASSEYIAWLKAGDCESPYCRAITADDTTKVPEFQAAYQKGLRQYGNKPAIAQQWLTTNLAPNLRYGFYLRRKALITNLLTGASAIQSAMTDSVTVKAVFIDIPVKATDKSTETFLVSNLLPIEIGGKGYIWVCEVEIGSNKKVTLPLQVPEQNKPVRKCEVVVRDLAVCGAGACGQK
jgi:hypothetical protein